MNIKNFARLTGFAYFLLMPTGFFGIMYISSLMVDGDMLKSLANIKENITMVRLSVATSLLLSLIQITLVLMMYKLFRIVNEIAARILVLSVILWIPITMLNEMNIGAALYIINNANIADEMAIIFIEMREYAIMIAGIFWGIWLVPLGYLIYKSDFIPKIIGVALFFGAFGYIVDSFVFIIAPELELELAIYLFPGEIMTMLWLLIMGVNEQKWQDVYNAS